MGIKKVEPTAKKSGVMSDKSGQDPPKGKPLYVESKNDPRYKSYQDSLKLYNITKDVKNPKHYLYPNSPIFGASYKGTNEALVKFAKTHGIKIRGTEKNSWEGKIKPVGSATWSEGSDYPIYKKPKQQVIVQRPKLAIQNNLKPKEPVQSNADISGLKPQVRQPKYYKIQENINQPFGGSQTNYRSSDLKNITSPDDLGPGNTRKITPIYQTKEEMVQTPPKKNERIVKSLRKKNNSDYKKLSIEGKVNKLLGDPKSKAVNDSDINPDENFVDNIRHASAGRYTQEAISSRFGGGVTGTIAGLVGSNLMGAAHEIRAVKRDKRPLGTKLRESGEDMFNNAFGSLVGALPTSAKSKTQTIYKSSFGNLLPDGYVSTPKGKKAGLSDNLYFKDEKGVIKRKY